MSAKKKNKLSKKIMSAKGIENIIEETLEDNDVLKEQMRKIILFEAKKAFKSKEFLKLIKEKVDDFMSNAMDDGYLFDDMYNDFQDELQNFMFDKVKLDFKIKK